MCGVNKKGHQWRSVPFMMRKLKLVTWVPGEVSNLPDVSFYFLFQEVGKIAVVLNLLSPLIFRAPVTSKTLLWTQML